MVWLHRTDARGRERGERPGPRWPRCAARLAPALLLALALSACASTVAIQDRTPPAARGAFVVGRDTLAFPNLVRALAPDRSVDFGNYCIIMARAVNQFFRFARFAPDQPALSDAEYTRLSGEVFGIPAWEAPRPAHRRLVIPGYPDLHAFSRARESAIKAAFGPQWLSMLHWRTWRVALPPPPGQQPRVARELLAELDRGQPAPLMITSFPEPDYLNHAVLVYDYRTSAGVLEFLAYDPNDPDNPLGLHFDAASRGFWVEPLPYSPAARIRAFRIYTSPLL
jgi:hypothetical protein